MKFEVPRFTNSKDMIGSKFKTGYVTLTTPIREYLSSKAKRQIYTSLLSHKNVRRPQKSGRPPILDTWIPGQKSENDK